MRNQEESDEAYKVRLIGNAFPLDSTVRTITAAGLWWRVVLHLGVEAEIAGAGELDWPGRDGGQLEHVATDNQGKGLSGPMGTRVFRRGQSRQNQFIVKKKKEQLLQDEAFRTTIEVRREHSALRTRAPAEAGD